MAWKACHGAFRGTGILPVRSTHGMEGRARGRLGRGLARL
jgi:hypothetical protein